jgi:hypothetical protein
MATNEAEQLADTVGELISERARLTQALQEALDALDLAAFALESRPGEGHALKVARAVLQKHGMGEARCVFCGKGGLTDEVDGANANSHARCR